MVQESIEEWVWSLAGCSYHRDHSPWLPGRAVPVLIAVNKLLVQTWRCQQVSGMKSLHQSCLFVKIKHWQKQSSISRCRSGQWVKFMGAWRDFQPVSPRMLCWGSNVHISPHWLPNFDKMKTKWKSASVTYKDRSWEGGREQLSRAQGSSKV